jgi:hypothetical protein
MGIFGEMFPGRRLGREASDEDSSGQGHQPRIPDGPLDLDTGVVRVVPPAEESDPAPGEDG